MTPDTIQHPLEGLVDLDATEVALYNEPVPPTLADEVRNTWERCKHTTQTLNALALVLAYYGDDEGSELLKVFARRMAAHEAGQL